MRLMATGVVGRKGKEGDGEVCKERNSMPRRWAPKRCACVLLLLLLLFSGMLMRGGDNFTVFTFFPLPSIAGALVFFFFLSSFPSFLGSALFPFRSCE